MSNHAIKKSCIPRSHDATVAAALCAFVLTIAGIAIYAVQDNAIRSIVVAVSSGFIAMVFFGIYECGSNYFVLKSGQMYFIENREGYRWANPAFERLTYPRSAIEVSQFEPNYLPGEAGTTLSITCNFKYVISDILSAVLAGDSEIEVSKTIYRKSLSLMHEENPIMDRLSSENIYQHEGMIKNKYVECLTKTLNEYGCELINEDKIVFKIELI